MNRSYSKATVFIVIFNYYHKRDMYRFKMSVVAILLYNRALGIYSRTGKYIRNWMATAHAIVCRL